MGKADIDVAQALANTRSMRAFCLLLPVLFLAESGVAASRPAKHSKLEGMSYNKARAMILAYGWKPLAHKCMQVEPSVCARYPEIEICQMISPGTCEMEFSKSNRCLSIEAIEGPPDPAINHTRVTRVDYYQMPCSTG